MKPTDALEIQREYRNKCEEKYFVDLLNSMITSASGVKAHQKANKEIMYGGKKSDVKEAQEVVNEYTTSAIRVGNYNTPCYFVKDEMSDLIMFASNKLDDTDLFDETLVPSNKGFVYFEKPLEIQDVRGRQLLINVLVWEKGVSEITGKPIMAITCYNDALRSPDDIAKAILYGKTKWTDDKTFDITTNVNNEKDETRDKILKIIGRFHWVHSASYEHGEVIGEALKKADENESSMLRLVTTDNDEKFVEMSDEEWETYKKEKLYPYTNVRRLIYTYFLIMSQTITTKTPERGDRAQRRRLERQDLPSEVLVIQFRKTRYTSADKGEERHINWSHRWIVGGHWRWQPYKDPASGGEIKKRIWISPYVKGPDDKPLKTKERVYVLAK